MIVIAIIPFAAVGYCIMMRLDRFIDRKGGKEYEFDINADTGTVVDMDIDYPD